jgi:DNA modification methylase
MAEQQRMDYGRLYFGDNLKVLPRHIDSESVDLVYLDPPFNSGKDYNLLFEHKDGTKAAAQIKAFEDTWQWNDISSREYEDVVAQGGDLSNAIRAFRQLLGGCDMLAYLTMMAPRLVELRRVLKPTGSIYLHCDPTASHYLKLLMDAVFGTDAFVNEVMWKRTSAHNRTVRYGPVHDSILFYCKGQPWYWKQQFVPYDASYIDNFYRHIEPVTGRRYRLSDVTSNRPGGSYLWKGKKPPGRRYWGYGESKMQEFEAASRLIYSKNGIPSYKRYLDEMPGEILQDVWTDIAPIGAQAAERVGYPTQKPLALLERIIEASCPPDGVVLDPFCGCGTAVDAAQKLGRRWVGIDVTELAIDIIRKRLTTQFGAVDYYLGGEPGTSDEAEALARLDKHEFQRWACEFIGAKNRSKKGADRGIDGTFDGTYEDGTPWRAIVSVKGGGLNVNMVRDLRGTIARENADIGIFLTLKPPTGPMKREATDAGFTDTGHARLQILTADDLFDGKRPDLPLRAEKQKRRGLSAVS